MNKRLMERERKRTEKTRWEMRSMNLRCFVHADGSSFFEGTNSGLLEGAKFRVVINGRYGYDKPDDMTVVEFLTKLTATHNPPAELYSYSIGKKNYRYEWPDGMIMQMLASLTFDYEVNEWNEKHNPGMAHPWRARSWANCRVPCDMMWDFVEPGRQKRWLNKIFKHVTEQYLNERIAAHDAKIVMAKLEEPWEVATV